MLSSGNVSLAGFLTLLVVGSAALLGVGPTALAQSQASPTLIAECQTIDESGTYQLTQNLSGAGEGPRGEACLYLTGEEITLDGQGYAVEDGDVRTGDLTGSGIRVTYLEIRDIHVPDGKIVYTGSNGVVESVTAEQVWIFDGITGTIRDSVITGAGEDVDSDGRVSDRAGIFVTDAEVVVEDTTIRGNDIGIGTSEAPFSVTVRNSEIRNNDVGIAFGPDMADARVRGSVIAGNDIGVSGGWREAADLRNNWWGASDGPASVYDNGSAAAEPWIDPTTGALANGSGEGIAPAYGGPEASVRFDPWLAVPALGDAFAGPPQDRDGDGLYEDVNGDGDVNVGDAQALFAFEDAAIVQENAALFDFNDDGAVDVGDAQALFAHVTG